MLPRIFAVIILIISVFFLPFWISAILALAGMIYFSYFIEAVVLFLISDLLYGTSEAKFFGATFVAFIAAAICIVLIELFKKRLKFHHR